MMLTLTSERNVTHMARQNNTLTPTEQQKADITLTLTYSSYVTHLTHKDMIQTHLRYGLQGDGGWMRR